MKYIIALIIIAGLAYGGYYLYTNNYHISKKGITKWVVYTNPNYNYSVEYPQDWYVYDEDRSNVRIQAEADNSDQAVTIEILDNPSHLTIEEFAQEHFAQTSFSTQYLKIADREAIKTRTRCEKPNCGQQEIFVSNSSQIFHLKQNLSDESYFNAIGRTLKLN